MTDKSESSLSQEGLPHLPSSPPGTSLDSLPVMEDESPKPAPVVSQAPQQTPNLPRHKRVGSDVTERPGSVQGGYDDLEERLTVEAEDDSLDEDEADPAVQIADFDWDDLHQRYHDVIKKSSREEEVLMQEWTGLMEYFQVWANAGHEHETDRTFRRLQTRTMYVRNEENDLEERRNHYANVVRAFESALNLLKQNTMFRG